MGHARAVQGIPTTVWFLAYAATAFACFHWHNRQPSPHLRMMGWGMCLVGLLLLPKLFSDWAGHDQLVRYAEKIMLPEDPAESFYRAHRDAGGRLLLFCSRLHWIGYATFALGIWRFAKELADKAAYPPVDQA
jgi:hypothetical protein